MIAGPRISIRERGLVLGEATGFRLDLHAASGPDLSVILDLYDLDHPVHPGGHLGWWKFPATQFGATAEGRLTTAGDLAVSMANATPSEFWINPQRPTARHLVLNAVLRSNATNGIIDIDRVPAMASAADLAALRRQIDRDWLTPRFAPAPFILDRGETVHLVLPNLFLRDAVGNLCLDIYRMLQQNSVAVRLHAANADLAINDIVEPQKALAKAVMPGDHLLYFYSTHDPYLAQLLDLPCRRTVYFHGITDPIRLRVFDPELSVVASRAREALPLLGRFDRLAANSQATAAVLSAALGQGAPPIAIIPPQLVAAATAAFAPQPRDGSLLTVCQLSPHKKVEDLLRLFAAYRADHPAAICNIVGRARSRAYRDYLSWVETQELGLPPGAVRWHGSVDGETLAGLYRRSGVYLSMSEDEGFCLPVLEAMRNGLPVFAYGLPAVVETLGGSGVIFTTKDFPYLAEKLGALLADDRRLEHLVAAQSERAAELGRHMAGREFFELLRP